MSERIHALAQQLLGKSSVEECTLEELQQLTKRYPFFAPAQFLLLQKLKTTNDADYNQQQQKALLFYHDPLQFDYFISSDKFFVDDAAIYGSGLVSDKAEGVTLAEDIEQIAPEEQTEAEENSYLQMESVETFSSDDNGADTQKINESVTEENEITPHESHLHLKPVLDGSSVPPKDEGIMQVHDDVLEEMPLPDNQTEPTTEETTPQKTAPETAEVDNSVSATEEEPLPVAEIDQPSNETPLPENGQTTDEKLPEEIKQGKQQPADNPEPLAFEPFHTVDYFASQGIKVTADEFPKDRLSKQMRSFTEWLKVMKRLPAAEMAKSPQSMTERSVENLASHSVEGSEVVTEAMAEVWAKQGAREKAIETYNKLSLLNPSRKAYFAAKIENLKGS